MSELNEERGKERGYRRRRRSKRRIQGVELSWLVGWLS